MKMNDRRTPAGAMALGGVLAALAVVVMCLGGMIPVATYVCPVVCILMLRIVLRLCGVRVAWAWYGAVSLLGLLMGPDKEAAAVFLFLGYYPILKPRMDRAKLPWLWKGLLFNGAILALYWVLMHLMGMEALVEEFSEMGTVMCLVLLALGNVVFFMLDRLLSLNFRRKKK